MAHSTARIKLFILLTALLCGAGAWAGAPAPLLEYLYIDANEDQASGGHAAVRIDEDVFHFQFVDGLLQMERDNWADFQLIYRGYQNRNIHASRLDIDTQTYRALRATFVERHVTQSRQISLLKDARRDRVVLNALLDQPTTELELPGFGFFRQPGPRAGNPAYDDGLRTLIAQQHGEQFLASQREQLQQQLANMPVVPLAVSPADFRPGKLPRPSYAFSQRYADTLAALLALDIIETGVDLSDASLDLATRASREWTLDPQERDALQRATGELQTQIVNLLASSRPDRGQALLLGLARLEAMRQSLAQNRWVFIDILDGDAKVVEIGPRTREFLPALEADAYQAWQAARDQWQAQPGWNESSYAEFEAVNARLLELRRVSAGANDWRIKSTRDIPRGMGRLDHPPRPIALTRTGGELIRRMEASSAQAEEYIQASAGYHVLDRNCVTELFQTMDMALARLLEETGQPVTEANLARETELRFGKPFSPNPIPFASASQVDRNWRVSDEQELPSLRRLYLAAQYQQNPDVAVWLKESNTLTSSVYQRSDKDSFFIFFTDGNPFIRPVLGLANLTAALGASVVGVVQAPFDGGKHLKAGLRGALFSLPELGFQNIRKGTNSWIAPELRSVAVE